MPKKFNVTGVCISEKHRMCVIEYEFGYNRIFTSSGKFSFTSLA